MANYVKNPYKYRNMRMSGLELYQRRLCGEAIEEYRRKNNLSRKQLSEIVENYSKKYGVRFTPQDIYNYERLRVSPKIEKLMALCIATDMPMSYFTGYRKTQKSYYRIAA